MQWIIVGSVFIAVCILLKAKRKELRVSGRLMAGLLAFHAICTVYYLTSTTGDWKMYYDRGRHYAELLRSFDYISPGTRFIVAISHLLHTLCNFHVGAMFALFSLIGLLGIVYLLAACRSKLTFPRDRKWLLLLFYPSIHFWSSALGKDALMFFAVNLLLFNVARRRYFGYGMILAIGLAFLVTMDKCWS